GVCPPRPSHGQSRVASRWARRGLRCRSRSYRSCSMRVFALGAFALLAAGSAFAEPRGFNVNDLVNLDRVADPRLSPDGRQVAFQLRETDYAANKGLQSLWLVP